MVEENLVWRRKMLRYACASTKNAETCFPACMSHEPCVWVMFPFFSLPLRVCKVPSTLDELTNSMDYLEQLKANTEQKEYEFEPLLERFKVLENHEFSITPEVTWLLSFYFITIFDCVCSCYITILVRSASIVCVICLALLAWWWSFSGSFPHLILRFPALTSTPFFPALACVQVRGRIDILDSSWKKYLQSLEDSEAMLLKTKVRIHV